MLEMFQYSFVVRAFIAGSIVGLICPLLGTFLVLRRLALIADTLAHVALAGVAVGLFFNRMPVAVAVGAAVLAAVLLERLRLSRRFEPDSALALVLYSALAITLVLIGLSRGFSVDLFGYLFGSIVTIGNADVWATVGLGIAVVLMAWLLFSELVQSTFDSELAKVHGVRVGLINLVVAILTAVTVTLAMRVVGALLVGALLVIPVMASLQLRFGFRRTLLAAMLFGLMSVLIGLTVSYHQDIAAGGAIVLTSLAILLIVSLVRSLMLRTARSRTT